MWGSHHQFAFRRDHQEGFIVLEIIHQRILYNHVDSACLGSTQFSGLVSQSWASWVQFKKKKKKLCILQEWSNGVRLTAWGWGGLEVQAHTELPAHLAPASLRILSVCRLQCPCLALGCSPLEALRCDVPPPAKPFPSFPPLATFQIREVSWFCGIGASVFISWSHYVRLTYRRKKQKCYFSIISKSEVSLLSPRRRDGICHWLEVEEMEES